MHRGRLSLRCLQHGCPLPLGHSQQQRLLAVHPPHDPIHGMRPSGSTVVGCSWVSHSSADDGRPAAAVRDDRKSCPAGYVSRRCVGCAGADRRFGESPIRVRELKRWLKRRNPECRLIQGDGAALTCVTISLEWLECYSVRPKGVYTIAQVLYTPWVTVHITLDQRRLNG